MTHMQSVRVCVCVCVREREMQPIDERLTHIYNNKGVLSFLS